MSQSAIQALERALKCTDMAMMTLEIMSALGSLKQQPGVIDDAKLHFKIETYVAKFDSAAQAAKALGVHKQTLHAVRHGFIACPPSILSALGLVKLPAGRTLYREV